MKTQQGYLCSPAKSLPAHVVERLMTGEVGGMPIPLVLVALAGTAMGSLLALAGGGSA